MSATTNELRELASAWRQQRRTTNGYVIVFAEKVAGWALELKEPTHWRPGCVAIDSEGRTFRAEGGNPQVGAQAWVRETEEAYAG